MEFFVRSLALSGGMWSNSTSANGTLTASRNSSATSVGSAVSLTLAPHASGNFSSNNLSAHILPKTTVSAPEPTATPMAINSTDSATFTNSTSLTSSAPTTTENPFFNGTDLNNATQCWPAYWSYSSMTWSWSRAHMTLLTKTITYTQTLSTGVPEPSPNSTYSVLCDGLPRFGSEDEAANATVLLPTPITTVGSSLTLHYIWPTGDNFPPAPSCSIRNTDECSVAWSLFGSSLSSSNDAWSTSNILTVSLASPPTSVVINSKATPLTAAPGAYPTLVLHGEEYGAERGTYTISGGTNLYGEVNLTPGGQQILTWDMDQITKPFGPTNANCSRPTGNIIQSRCATAECTLSAYSVEFLYFPPPSTSRDLCANTSPGFNSYSISIYSHPHASTIINTTTYWSDKAYVRYSAISAYKWCELDNQLGRTMVSVGETYSNRLYEVSSSDISSICDYKFGTTRPYGVVIGATAKPFNFEDLVGDIPASAYQCMPQCQSGCKNIVTARYVPGLAVPSQVRAQDPNWGSCVPVFDGVPDPPIALGTVPNFLTSTATSSTRHTDPPIPGQTISTEGPGPTQIPTTRAPVTTRFTSTILSPTSRPAPKDPNTPNNPEPPVVSSPNSPSDPTSPVDPNSNDPDSNDPRPNNPNPSPNNPSPNNPSLNNPSPNNPSPNSPSPDNPSPNNHSPNNPGPNDPPPNVPNPNNTVPNGTPPNAQPITAPPSGPTPVGTIGKSIINVDPSRPGIITISDPNTPDAAQTLTAGSDPVVISGTTVSVDPTSGAVIISGESTLQPIGTIGGKPVFTDSSQPGIVIVGGSGSGQPAQTLSMNGHSVVIDGITLSLAPTATTAPASINVAGLSISVLADGTIVVNNAQTIRPGGPQVFVDGHSVVVDQSGVVWVDGQRVDVSPASENKLGELVIVGPDGMTTTLDLPTATGVPDPSAFASALAMAVSDAWELGQSLSSSRGESGNTNAAATTSRTSASITSTMVDEESSTQRAPNSSETKSESTRPKGMSSLLGLGSWIFMMSMIWS